MNILYWGLALIIVIGLTWLITKIAARTWFSEKHRHLTRLMAVEEDEVEKEKGDKHI